MKLPGMTYRQAGTPQSMGPGTAIAEYRAKQDILQAGVEVGRVVAEEKIESDTARANADYRDRISGLQTSLSGVDELSRDELIALGADEANSSINWVDGDGNEVQTFKKYEVEAALMSQVMENQISQAGGNIASNKYRKAWQDSVRESNDAEVLRISNRSAKEAKDYEYKTTIAELEALNSNPVAQLEYAMTAPALKGSPDVRAKYVNKARDGVFEQQTNDTINNGSDAQLESLIGNMVTPEYRESLGVSERRMQVLTNRAKNELEQRNREGDRLAALSEKERNDAAKDAYQNLSEAVESGVEITDDDWERTKLLTSGTDYSDAVDRVDRTRQFLLLDKDSRKDALMSANDFDTAEDYGALRAANDALNKRVAEDGFQVAWQQEVVSPVPMTPDSLRDPNWVAGRQRQAEIASNHYGYPVSPFTQVEVDGITQSLSMMTSGQQAGMAMAFSSMPSVWKQFSKSGASVFSVVGAEGDREMAQSALRGQQAIDSKTVILPSANEMIAASAPYLGDVYDIENRKAVIDTARAIYADIAPIGEDGDFSQDSWADALEMVTGGISEVNGYKVEIPRGTDPQVMQDYVDMFSAKDVADFGGVDGYSDEQAAEIIRDGRWKSVGKDKYRIDVGNTTLMSGSEPFIITYDKRAEFQQKATDYSYNRQRVGIKLTGSETARPEHFRR